MNAARLCARPGELAAMLAAIRSEEQAALKALKDQAALEAGDKRFARQRASRTAWEAVLRQHQADRPTRGLRRDQRPRQVQR